MLADKFSQIFRDEHRQVRDCLLALSQAFKDQELPRVGSLLGDVAALTGPHFRYEEESLYPSLVGVFGEEYIEKLLADHDQAIGSAGRLVALAGQESLSPEDVDLAVKLIRGILPHVSDCEGLSIMTEVLPEEKVQAVLDSREQALQANLNLIDWAGQVRKRSAATV